MTEHKPDLIYGLSRIAAYLRISLNQARERQDQGELPTFRMGTGTTLYARPSKLDKYKLKQAGKRREPPRRRGRPPHPDAAARKALNTQKRKDADRKARIEAAIKKSRSIARERAAGLLYGAVDISSYLGLSIRQVYHLHEASKIPTFLMGRMICSRKNDLNDYFVNLEEAAGGK